QPNTSRWNWGMTVGSSCIGTTLRIPTYCCSGRSSIIGSPIICFPPEPVVERHEVAFVCSKFAIEPKAPPRTGHYTLAVLALHGRNRPIHLSMGWHAFCRYAPEPGGRFPLLRRTGSRHGHPGRAAADAYPLRRP